MNRIVQRVVLAYGPLSQRGRLVEGPYPQPPADARPPRRPKTRFTLAAIVFGRQPAPGTR